LQFARAATARGHESGDGAPVTMLRRNNDGHAAWLAFRPASVDNPGSPCDARLDKRAVAGTHLPGSA
jgi:hypothetical protein